MILDRPRGRPSFSSEAPNDVALATTVAEEAADLVGEQSNPMFWGIPVLIRDFLGITNGAKNSQKKKANMKCGKPP